MFPKLPLSEAEWRTVISYHFLQAEHRCEGAAAETVLMAVNHYKYIVKKITGMSLSEFVKKVGYQAPKGEDSFDIKVKELTGMSIAEHLKKSGDPSVKGDDALDVAELFYFPVEYLLQSELKYKKIDPKSRQILEAISELNQPFDPLAASEVLGLNPH